MSFADCGIWWNATYQAPCLRCHKKGCECCGGSGVHRTRVAAQQADPNRKQPTSGFNQSNKRAFNDR